MDFMQADVAHISSEQLDAWFNGKSDTPATTNPAQNTQNSNDNNNNSLFNNTISDGLGNLPTLDDDQIIIDESTETPSVTNEEEIDNEGSEENIQEEETKNSDNPIEEEQIKSVLKSTVKYLIDQGRWDDIDGLDDLELTDEVYAEIALKQDEKRLEDKFQSLLERQGSYGKAILEYERNGGNPDDLIDIFKEQKTTNDIDISTKEGSLYVIHKYYSEVVGWDKADVNKHIERLATEEGALEQEAQKAQSRFDSIYRKQTEQLKQQQAFEAQEQKRIQQEYINTLSQNIDSYETFTEKDKKLIKDSVLKFDKTLEDGTPVNDFYLKFYEIQRDPKRFIELIHFIVDNDNYKSRIKTQEQNKATEKVWNFVKGNAALKNKPNTQTPQLQDKKSFKTDFSGLFK